MDHYLRHAAVRTALLLILLMAIANTLGCATTEDLKPCDKVNVSAVRTEVGPLFVLDMEGLEALGRRMKGLWERTCTP